MSAREDLRDFIFQNSYAHDMPYRLDRSRPRGGEDIPYGEYPAVVNEMIDAYAHELAEKIRANGCQEINWCGCPLAADLIDPEVSDD
jgi:hypothetical protein